MRKMSKGKNSNSIYSGQHWHFLILLILLAGVYCYIQFDKNVLQGRFCGEHTSTYFIIALIAPILHQVYVVVFWRLELFYRWMSRKFGENGFLIFKLGFAFFFVSRLITIILLAFSNRNSLGISEFVGYALACLFAIPSLLGLTISTLKNTKM